jgi:hypothetical protein
MSDVSTKQRQNVVVEEMITLRLLQGNIKYRCNKLNSSNWKTPDDTSKNSKYQNCQCDTLFTRLFLNVAKAIMNVSLASLQSFLHVKKINGCKIIFRTFSTHPILTKLCFPCRFSAYVKEHFTCTDDYWLAELTFAIVDVVHLKTTW